MKEFKTDRQSERGSAAVKFLAVFVVLFLVAHAGWNYVPVAYQGASFRQEMDTAVVKALGAQGRLKPVDIVNASVKKALFDFDIPDDAEVEIGPVNGVVEVRVAYTRDVNMLPFGLYKYKYNFDYTAKPTGYLLKE